jgi:AcrR family transcriptional regulator
MRTANPERITERQTAIRNAALMCFARRGFHATTMRDIAREASVSLGLLYRYFGNKAALIGSAIEAETGDFLQRLSVLKTEQSNVDDVAAFLRSEIDLRVEPTTYRLTAEIMAEAARELDLHATIQENITSAETGLANVLQTITFPTGTRLDRDHAGSVAATLLATVEYLAARRFFQTTEVTVDPIDVVLGQI